MFIHFCSVNTPTVVDSTYQCEVPAVGKLSVLTSLSPFMNESKVSFTLASALNLSSKVPNVHLVGTSKRK